MLCPLRGSMSTVLHASRHIKSTLLNNHTRKTFFASSRTLNASSPRKKLLNTSSPRNVFLPSATTQRSKRFFRTPAGTPPYLWYSAGGATLLVGFIYYEFLEEVPLTHRKRWIVTSVEWERQMGDEEYKKLAKKYKKDTLPPHHQAVQTVRRVGARVVAASVEFSQSQNLASSSSSPTTTRTPTSNLGQYTYTVVRSNEANAFVLPGNHVFVMTGLFRYVRDEDELAAVLGHEIAHNLARHAGERISGSLVVNLFARISLLVDPSGLLLSILLPTATVLTELPHSRLQETEADQIGVHLAARACYDPRAAKRVFSAMKADADGGYGPEFLSTHPSHESRISNFDKWLPEAMDTYRGEGSDKCERVRQEMSQARKHAARAQSWVGTERSV